MNQEFKHGDKVTCEINGVFIEDAVIIEAGGSLCICNNTHGWKAHVNPDIDLMGYSFGWFYPSDMVKNLQLAQEETTKGLTMTAEEFDKIMDDGIKSGEKRDECITLSYTTPFNRSISAVDLDSLRWE